MLSLTYKRGKECKIIFFFTIHVNFRIEEVDQQSKYIVMHTNTFTADHQGYKFRHIMPLEIKSLITSQEWPYVEVRDGLKEGRGVFAKVNIDKNKVVCNYRGLILSAEEASKTLLNEPSKCDYLLEMNENINRQTVKFYKNHDMMTDNIIGKYINHSKIHPNLKCRLSVMSKGVINVLFITIRNIVAGEQLIWDYGNSYNGVQNCVEDCPKCQSLKK